MKLANSVRNLVWGGRVAPRAPASVKPGGEGTMNGAKPGAKQRLVAFLPFPGAPGLMRPTNADLWVQCAKFCSGMLSQKTMRPHRFLGEAGFRQSFEQSWRGDSRAFSLVEVMCAILILGIGLAGMAHGITTALRSNKESELQTAAALLAAGQIETLRAEGFLVRGTEEGTGSGALSQYHWVQRVTETDIEGLFEVAVTVRHGNSEPAVYKLETMLFDPPLLTRRDDDSRDRARERERRQR